ncbi:MAG TPA: protein kinase [Polyangiaceae bacterium]|nr:protein kinase [Polyangiaceae bacterium]
MFPQIFGKYVLERPLAVGGMARVFLATLRGADGFEKKLVVKQIRAELATDDAFVRRFVEEAKTTVELSHPNIVPIYELGVEQGIYYLAMELCDGVTLAELLRAAQKLTPQEGAYIGIEICRALDYAHRKARIIHRDVTPRNVVIDEEGAVRLIDFGIAAPAYDGANEVFGSPGHMPPEQLRGDEVGPPADVFAVATLLYEAWSGRAPFRRKTAEQSEVALSEPVAPLSHFDPALAPLDALVASALAIDPAQRPQSAEELSRPLRRFIAECDPGDLTRKVGARVREVRASTDPDAGPALPENPASATPAVNETRTFATRSHEPVPSGVPVAPSPSPRHDAAPYVATRRMSDDAGSWSSAGAPRGARASVRPARAPSYRAIAGMALGLLVVAAVAGAAWRYGEPAARTADAGGEIEQRATTAALGEHAPQRTTSTAMDPAGNATGETAPATEAPVATTGTAAPPPASGTLASATPSTGAVAHVRILANPMASVEIDGKPRGVAPIAEIALAPGTHFIRLDCSALGEAVAQNVPVAAGENVTISGDFTGAHGRILVRRANAGH